MNTSSFFAWRMFIMNYGRLRPGAITNDEMQPSQKATCLRAVAIGFGRAPSLKLWRKRPETGRQVDRRNLIFFFEYPKIFFEAVRLLLNKHKKKKYMEHG